MPSEIYARFERMIHAATPEQAAALLRHQSPIVRGYLVWHVLDELHSAVQALYPLLGDPTRVEVRQGCRGGTLTIAELAIERLESRLDSPTVQALLLRAAQDPQLGPQRASLLFPVARHRPQEATAIANRWLHETEAPLIIAALETLHVTEPKKSDEVICAHASAPQREIRLTVIGLLAVIENPCAEPSLRKLTEDRDGQVRLRASDIYPRIRQRDPAVLRHLLADANSNIRDQVATALAQRANEQDLDLLRAYLVANPNNQQVVYWLDKTGTAAVTALWRELCVTARAKMTWFTRRQLCAAKP